MPTEKGGAPKGSKIAEIVREKLRTAKVRRSQLAEWLGVDRSMASMMMSGKRGFAQWHLVTIADKLHCSVSDFFPPAPEENEVQQSSGIDALTRKGGNGARSSLHSAELFVLAISEAAAVFHDLSEQFHQWYERLADLAASLGGQTADARPHSSSRSSGTGTHHGSDAGTPRGRKAQ